ncbi:MAG TPA: hypothetical protein VNK23_02050 [Candidatus Dormibacteraeota bacterium]|nr:hypothetical protein [Candidatus Dormibacteraeota bacterium]
MAAKRAKAKRLERISASDNGAGRVIQWGTPATASSTIHLRSSMMSSKHASRGNRYLCALERNQNGKYNVRVRAFFASGERAGASDGGGASAEKAGWSLPVYFLASSFNAAMKKLEESLQTLQKNEERLRFWGLERSDDPNVAGELLQELGLWLDRRQDFPRKTAEIAAPTERAVTASALASIRRVLADSLAQDRPIGRPALAGD